MALPSEGLREKDIELIRQWRNSPQINQFMEFRGNISPEKQREWFKSVNNFDNFYFIIEYQGKKYRADQFESTLNGIRSAPKEAFFCGMNSITKLLYRSGHLFACSKPRYFVLGAGRSVIKTLRDNERAKKLNIHLGYELMEGQEEAYNQTYLLTAESFKRHAHKLIKAATLLAGQ